MPEVVANNLVVRAADVIAIAGGNFSDRVAHGKVYRIERRHFRGEGRGKGGLGVIHLYLADDLAGHHVGLPAFGFAVSLFLHL